MVPCLVVATGQEMYGLELYAAVRLAVVDEGSEPSRGGPSVRHRPPDGEEDAELFGAAGLPADEACAGDRSWTGSPASSTRSWRRTRIRRCRASSGTRRTGSSSVFATSTGSAGGYTIVKDYVRSRRQSDARGLRSTASPAGPCPGRLRRGDVVEVGGQAGEGCLLLPDPAPFQRLVRQGLSEGDDGGLPGRPCQRPRLSRRGATLDPL